MRRSTSWTLFSIAVVAAGIWASPRAAEAEELPSWFGGFSGPGVSADEPAASDPAPSPIPMARPTQLHQDWGQGISWYQREAAAGDAEVQLRLAEILMSGLLGEPDLPGARRWYEAAARQGNPIAQFRLATLLQQGLGGPADAEAAAEWYMTAALADVGPAAYNLAVMLDGAVGVPGDLDTAARLYALAAKNGIGAAATNLGLLYLQGRGLPRDEVLALSWLTIAAEAGAAGAEQTRRALAASLDPGQQQAAAEQARTLIRR